MDDIKFELNHMPKPADTKLHLMSKEDTCKALAFHASMPGYAPTPLAELPAMASRLGLGEVAVKDESFRFGLNAFKVLGGSFAMARYIAGRLNMDVKELPYDKLVSEQTKEKLGEVSFFTATDGNHGRGVAWAANKLGQKAFVFMPKGTSSTRLNNILAEGAFAQIEEFNYDDCVRKAADEAAKVNGVVVQDTAWDGYEEIPTWIMQGYGTMAKEADDVFFARYGVPTHVFVQAGVGSLAGAVSGYFANKYGENCPKITVVEAKAADCLYRSAVAGDGVPVAVGGDLTTIMAGLACGEANTISWEILKTAAACFVSAPDWVCELGMRVLGNPLDGDTRVKSGESGAVNMGALFAAMTMPEYAPLKEALGLCETSKVLLFSTEGDTDPDMYRKIVW